MELNLIIILTTTTIFSTSRVVATNIFPQLKRAIITDSYVGESHVVVMGVFLPEPIGMGGVCVKLGPDLEKKESRVW